MGTSRPHTRHRWVDIVLLIIIALGIGILLYPWVSQLYNQTLQGRAVVTYDAAIARLTPEDYSQMWDEVDAYNRALAQSGGIATSNGQVSGDVREKDHTTPDGESTEDAGQTDSQTQTQSAEELLNSYDELLNPIGTGMMGHIEIDKLGVDLPVYHGVSDDVLTSGIGHIEGSSLPGGGPSTHTVLSGHRGLPQSILFTDLDRLQSGDVFLLHMLDRTLAYQVDQIRIVLPDQLADLAIEPGEDYCTLVTCTPYAINTHRLLVRGHRIDYPDRGYVAADAVRVDPVVVSLIIATPVFVIGLAGLGIYIVRRRKRERAA